MENLELKSEINTLTYMLRNNVNLSYYLNDKLLFLMSKLTLEAYWDWTEANKRLNKEENIFSKEELAAYNGLAGKPSYVAVDGIVYDVSENELWAGGHHFGLTAGNILTEDFKNCHPDSNILSKLKKVGTL